MGLNQFLQEVNDELHQIFGRDLFGEPAGGELERLKRELHQASTALTELRTIVAELRTRLAEQERRARWLEARVGIFLHVADRTNAWRHALELDRIRHTLDRDRAGLQRRRQAYHAQRARIRQLEEQLATALSEKYAKG
jgi:hypothetical protein